MDCKRKITRHTVIARALLIAVNTIFHFFRYCSLCDDVYFPNSMAKVQCCLLKQDVKEFATRSKGRLDSWIEIPVVPPEHITLPQ